LISLSNEAIDAGPFGEWLAQFRDSLRGRGGTNVPCGTCVGCCISSYSILVRPEDTQTLAVIPAGLLTSVESLGVGVKAMGYLHDGSCPMLHAGKCSIYADRPQTCRDYDCRVFAAAGIEAGPNKTVINERVGKWRFSYPGESDRAAHHAIEAAAAFIREHGKAFPELRFPKHPSGIAVLAAKSYEVFLDPPQQLCDADIAAAVDKLSREFDASASQ